MMDEFEIGSISTFDEGAIPLHGEAAFVAMRKAGQLTAQCLDELTDLIKPGLTTQAIDDYVYEFGMRHDALPATLYYRGFCKSCCTSVNHVVCHGIPNNKSLKEGDIINVDVTFIVDGWHGDSSRMYTVGEVKRVAQRLVDVTWQSLMIGIEQVKPGNTTGDIGAAIQEYVEGMDFSVVRDFCGHGLGRKFHEAPRVMHFGQRGEGLELVPGMFFTIEPMVNAGKYDVKVLPKDGWTAVTRDRSLSAQFEHSIAVTEKGCEIFTLSPAGFTCPPYMKG